ncbi:hypothetical protein Phum_PHUM344520 [Pediculus humanus corporis]|uniref:Oxidoreductase-like domain-containing protein n=1 Tax=Pediculus humanus subsp. corporis TaxID=121224 RepID=E0VNT2_PEDHC|nr:uncharacterized protein Phum_PHUM344520 [Pediculus humanus corporis]EEB15038.1 hypothetical protein Phum_PHUM344520 [Pediculus humanus corporis]
MDIIFSDCRGSSSDSLWRNRIRRGNQNLVSREAERDLKLMVTILSVEHYVLMIFGVLQTNPALLMPWLMMEAMIVALESVFFGMRLFAEGLTINRTEIFMSGLFCCYSSLNASNSNNTSDKGGEKCENNNNNKKNDEENLVLGKKYDLPPEPTTECCCNSACSNCVWIKYAQELGRHFENGDVIAKNKINEKVRDPNLRAFLLLQLGLDNK